MSVVLGALPLVLQALAGLAAALGPAGAAAQPAIDPGTRTTAWYAGTPTRPPVVPGSWRAAGPSPAQAGFRLLRESAHFAFYSDEAVSPADLQRAADTLENIVWQQFFNTGLLMPEPYSDRADKLKVAIHIHSGWGLTGGAWVDPAGLLHLGMWISAEALLDHWGLAHEFTHGWQAWATNAGGLDCPTRDTCGWIHESHANFTPHQLPEYRNSVHCSEMLPNVPHLYLGSTRDRYCNWQFMEYLKDRFGPQAVTRIWTTRGSDPFLTLSASRGWRQSQLNDFIGEWALHNVVWDYKATPEAFRSNYGSIVQADRAERMRRLMPLEPLDANWRTHRRFVVPHFGAPQRFGYNVVRLYPVDGATSVTVSFRGVDVPGAQADFRWGLVATDASFRSARYSALQRGLTGELRFRVTPGEPLFLVVAGTPSVHQSITWDQDYRTIWRYPYMVQLAGAWPQGFRNGQVEPCPAGTVRHRNGGGCAPATTPQSVYVGPYARVLPGSRVLGTARIEDQAIVANGVVAGGIVGGISVVGTTGGPGGFNAFNVGDQARVRTTFYPLGFFEPGQGAAGSLSLYGDVEYRGAGLTLATGERTGFVDATTPATALRDINPRVARVWRP